MTTAAAFFRATAGTDTAGHYLLLHYVLKKDHVLYSMVHHSKAKPFPLYRCPSDPDTASHQGTCGFCSSYALNCQIAHTYRGPGEGANLAPARPLGSYKKPTQLWLTLDGVNNCFAWSGMALGSSIRFFIKDDFTEYSAATEHY